MRRLSLLIALSSVCMLIPDAAAACTLGMYTYNNTWVDDDGNLVGENYSQGDSNPCSSYTAAATVTVTMPGGASQWSSATGASFADAIAQSVVSSGQGNGTLDGDNEVDYSCGDSLFSSFSTPFTAVACSCEGLNRIPSGNQCGMHCSCVDGHDAVVLFQTTTGPYALKKPPCNMQLSCPFEMEAIKLDLIFANFYAAQACRFIWP